MRTLLLATLLALGLQAGTAAAECRQEDDAPLVTRIQTIDGKPTIVIEKEIIVCGHPPRPAVAYVTPAKSVDWQWDKLSEDLVGKIAGSVKQLVGGSK